MLNRNLDGIYFRVNRGNSWQNVCLSDLTDEERAVCLQRYEPDQLIKCIDNLCDVIQYLGNEYNIMGT